MYQLLSESGGNSLSKCFLLAGERRGGDSVWCRLDISNFPKSFIIQNKEAFVGTGTRENVATQGTSRLREIMERFKTNLRIK